jgi:hypothetical protein
MCRRTFVLAATLLGLAADACPLGLPTQLRVAEPSAATRLAEANRDFTYRGIPISLRAVKELLSSPSDSVPGPVAIDLEGTWHSNRYFGEFPRRPHDRVYIDWRTTELKPPSGDPGWFAYGRVGTLPSGVHVLETWDNEGGSGVFTSLLLVRFTVDEEQSDGGRRQRLVMLRVGEVTRADRYDGTIRVHGHVVEIGADRRSGTKERVLDVDWLR